MTASCVVPTFEATSPSTLLDQALSENAPERLDLVALKGLSPSQWFHKRSFELDVESFAHGVVQHLLHALTPDTSGVVPSPVRSASVYTLPHRRRGATAFEQPHRWARVMHHAQRFPGWAPIARFAAHVPVPSHSPWSWAWLWALPDGLRQTLNDDPACPWGVAGMASRLDTDGFSAWEALVQPQAWSSTMADQLYERWGLDHPAFTGQMVAAWRANNPGAQRWWLDRASEEQVVAQINAWHVERAPSQQGHAPVIALERHRLNATLTIEPTGGPGRRRL